MDIVYGISLSCPEDSYILLIEEVLKSFVDMKTPGAFLADVFPVLQYIPAWCPGGSAQRFAAEHRPSVTALRRKPFDVVKAELVCAHSRATTEADMRL